MDIHTHTVRTSEVPSMEIPMSAAIIRRATESFRMLVSVSMSLGRMDTLLVSFPVSVAMSLTMSVDSVTLSLVMFAYVLCL